MAKKKPLIDIAPDCEARARAFMDWYGLNADQLRRYVDNYDEDLFSDAFLRAYEAIARRCTVVKNPTAYFIRAYRATFLDACKKTNKRGGDVSGDLPVRGVDLESPLYEIEVDRVRCEILDYVRDTYDEISVSLFEIYEGLAPAMSYRRISEVLGLPEYVVRSRIRPIRKDVVKMFRERKEYLLSMVDEN